MFLSCRHCASVGLSKQYKLRNALCHAGASPVDFHPEEKAGGVVLEDDNVTEKNWRHPVSTLDASTIQEGTYRALLKNIGTY